MLTQDNNKTVITQGCYNPPPKEGKRPSGEDSHLAKLTWDTVRKIRRRAADGVRYTRLAEDYGVTPQTIRQIVRHDTWREQ